MKKKKLFLGLLACSAILGLAACGENTKKSSKEDAKTSEVASSEAASSSAASSSAVSTVASSSKEASSKKASSQAAVSSSKESSSVASSSQIKEYAEYKINYLFEEKRDDGKVSFALDQDYTQVLTGEVGETITPPDRVFEGFELFNKNASIVIKEDGSAELNLSYKRVEYTITYITNNGTTLESEKVKYGYTLKEHVLTKENCQYLGWQCNGIDYDFNTPISSDITLECLFVPNDERVYTIKYYLEDVVGGYDFYQSATRYGKAGDTVVAEDIEVEHFHKELESVSGVVLDDGSLVLEVRYNRETYTISYTADSYVNIEPQEYRYGFPYRLPNVSREGYTVDYWKRVGSDTVEAYFLIEDDTEIFVAWAPNTDTEVSVNVYMENFNTGTSAYEYTLDNSFKATGTTDSIIDPESLYELPKGFEFDTELTDYDKVVAADGSTVVNIYLKRKLYSLSVVENEAISYNISYNTVNFDGKFKYDTRIEINITDISLAYRFRGMRNTNNNKLLTDNTTFLLNIDDDFNIEVLLEEYSELANFNYTATSTKLAIDGVKDWSLITDGVVTLPSKATAISSEAFKKNTSIKKLIVNSNLDTIYKSAFEYSSIEEVEFPTNSSLVSININAFYECDNLKTIKIPNTVKTIGPSAFSYSGLEGNITIPSTVEKIYDTAFYGTNINVSFENFSNLTLGTSVFYGATIEKFKYTSTTTISKTTFNNATINSLVIGNDITAIADGMFKEVSIGTLSFEENSTLKTIGKASFSGIAFTNEIVFPKSLETIDNEAFLKSTMLGAKFEDNSVLTTIGQSAFDYSNLKEVYLPDSVTTIGAYAFRGNRLRIAYLGKNVSSIGTYAFFSNDIRVLLNNSSLDISAGQTTYGYAGYYTHYVYTGNDINNVHFEDDTIYYQDSENKILIASFKTDKEMVIDDTYTEIGTYAFSTNYNIVKVIVGSNVTTIGEYAFNNCFKIRSVKLGEKVTTIGNNAFYNCTVLELINLSTISITTSNASIVSAFIRNISTDSNYTSLVTYDDNFVYYDIDNAKELIGYVGDSNVDVVIPDGIKSIYYAFDRDKVTSIKIPASVEVLGKCAFNYVTVSKIEFAENSKLERIDTFAFYHSGYLAPIGSFVIPKSVTTIGDYAFRYGTFTSLTFEDGSQIEEIGTGAFMDTTITNELKLPNSIKTLGENAFRKANISAVKLGSNITEIPQYAFYSSTISTVEFYDENNIVTIGKQAFYESKITSFTLSSDLTTIGDNAFYNCTSLATITNYSSLNLTIGSESYGYVAYYATEIITE